MKSLLALVVLLLLVLAAGHTEALLGRHHAHGDSVRAAAHLPGRITLQGRDLASKSRPVDASEGSKHNIPQILHYIFISGFSEYEKQTEVPWARMKRAFYDSCVVVHQHWEIMFWTQQKAEELLKTHFDWFLPVWETYDMEVKRADAIRPFILHHYGGVYLDLDNECFEPIEKLFESFESTDEAKIVKQHDVILQGSGWEGVNNGMMASAPGHPIWMKLVDILKERYRGSEEDPSTRLPLYMTGPAALMTAVQGYLNLSEPVSGFINKYYEVDNTVIKIYCLDQVCQRQLDRGLSHGTWDTSQLVGRHWFAGTWNTPEQLTPKTFSRITLPTVPEDTEQMLNRRIDTAAAALEAHGDISHMW